MNNMYEIERKFLINYPDESFFAGCKISYEIQQVYLARDYEGFSSRIRKRSDGVNIEYFHTRKKRISDIRRIEIENLITEEEYTSLLSMKDPDKNTVIKRRYCYEYKGKLFEIDIFPFWHDRAIMEIELSDEQELFDIPNELKIIKEVTGDSRYTNSSLAKEIPFDLI